MMQIDSSGLGFTRQGARILVHYPRKDAKGAASYAAGFDMGDIPPFYWTAPTTLAPASPLDNTTISVVTAERVAIWRTL